MKKHTPGPWLYRPQMYDDWGYVRSEDGVICQARDPNALDEEILRQHRAAKTDPWEANARLITAAPDLLAALQAIGALPEGYCFCPDMRDATRPEHTGECRDARAAIRKALGEE